MVLANFRARSPLRCGLTPLTAAAMAGLLGLLAGCGSGSSGTGATQRTQQIYVSPVTSAGAPTGGYRVTSRAANATCSAGSESIGQAYRCFAGNAIYDPCWAAKATKPVVLCVADPWLHTEAELRVSSALGPIPAGTGGDIGEPWGVELSGGQRCLLAQGAHTVFDGAVIDYYCSSGLSLLRGLGLGSATWTARSVIDKSGKLSDGPAEKIEIAWYGSPARFQ